MTAVDPDDLTDRETEQSIIELMDALARSVAEAKEARDRHIAAKADGARGPHADPAPDPKDGP